MDVRCSTCTTCFSPDSVAVVRHSFPAWRNDGIYPCKSCTDRCFVSRGAARRREVVCTSRVKQFCAASTVRYFGVTQCLVVLIVLRGITTSEIGKLAKMDRPTSLLDLPDEMLLKIVKRLDSTNDIPAMAQTCDRLASVAFDEVFWSSKLLAAGVSVVPSHKTVGNPVASETVANKMLIRDQAIMSAYYLYQVTLTSSGLAVVADPAERQNSLENGFWRRLHGLHTAVGTIQGALKSLAHRLSLKLDDDPASQSCPRYALTGPGLDSRRTKKLVAAMLADQQYHFMTTTLFQRRSQQGRLSAQQWRMANSAAGGGVVVRTECGYAEILTLYGNSARLRISEATSCQRLEHSRMHAPHPNEPGEYVIRDEIRDVCNDCDAVIFAVDGSTNPLNVASMDGLELRAFLRPLQHDKPVLILNCQEDSDAQVVSNDELASKLDVFSAPNPIAIVRVDSNNVVESGRMGFAWLKLRNQLPDVRCHKHASR